MYNVASYNGYHGNCNQILNTRAVATSTLLLVSYTLPVPTLFNPEAGIIVHVLHILKCSLKSWPKNQLTIETLNYQE